MCKSGSIFSISQNIGFITHRSYFACLSPPVFVGILDFLYLHTDKPVDLWRVVADIADEPSGTPPLFIKEVNVSKEIVRPCNSWVYRRYMKDKSLINGEGLARSKGLGIWVLPAHQRVKPWT